MTSPAQALREVLARGEAVLLRAHGVAGGGLLLGLQVFGAALSSLNGVEVDEWPSYPPSRKGGLVTGWLRAAQGRVEPGAPAGRPDIVVVVNEEAADQVDFAEGTSEALYVLNTRRTPEAAAARWRLGGTVVTIAGDSLAKKHLGRPLANAAVLAALVKAVGLPAQAARTALRERLRRRALPERVVEANLALFAEALEAVKQAQTPAVGTAHPWRPFTGFGELPAGAQTSLRTSLSRKRIDRGLRVEFADPEGRCDGCGLCVAQCPEGIIELAGDFEQVRHCSCARGNRQVDV